MQNHLNRPQRGESCTIAKGVSARAGMGSGDAPGTSDQPRADFWSAAGAIFAQQNRIPRLTRFSQNGPIPLSLAQERLWTLEQSEQGAPYYHVPLTWHINGQLNIPALES